MGPFQGASTQEIKLESVRWVKNKGSPRLKLRHHVVALKVGPREEDESGRKVDLMSLTPEDTFPLPLSPVPPALTEPEVRKGGAPQGATLPAPTFLINPLKPWFHVPRAPGFMSQFQWNVTLGQATVKTPHYERGNVWKENYLPKAVLNQCCPNIYLAHTWRSCANVCQRMWLYKVTGSGKRAYHFTNNLKMA